MTINTYALMHKKYTIISSTPITSLSSKNLKGINAAIAAASNSVNMNHSLGAALFRHGKCYVQDR